MASTSVKKFAQARADSKLKRYTAVVLGAGGVGKSALVMRYERNVFLEQYNPTIEEEYDCVVDYEGQKSLLQILDTPGVEQFTQINEGFIKRGLGFILVFSLTQEATVQEVDQILEQIRSVRGGDKDIPMVVVATKMDLSYEREVTPEAIKELAARWGIPIYETSAKNGWHVKEVFNHLVSQMRKRYPEGGPKERTRHRDACTLM